MGTASCCVRRNYRRLPETPDVTTAERAQFKANPQRKPRFDRHSTMRIRPSESGHRLARPPCSPTPESTSRKLELRELEQRARRPRAARAFTPARSSSGSIKRGVTDFALMSDLGRELRAELAAAFVVATPAVDATRAVGGRHDEVPAAARGRQAHRVGLHPRHAVADVLHLDPGRMRDEMRVLPDRQDGDRSQSDGGRNRRPGPRAARASSACSTPASTSS